MKFKQPEDISAIKDDALGKLLDAALDEYSELNKIAEADLTDEQIDDMLALKESIKGIRGERKAREEAVVARAEKIANAKAELEEDEPEPEPEPEEGEEGEEGEEEGEDAEADAKEPALVAAGSKTRAVARVRKPKVDAEEEDDKPEGRSVSMIAAADIKGFANGQDIDMDGVTKAFMNRIAGMPKGRVGGKGGQINKYGVAEFNKTPEPAFKDYTITPTTSDAVAWANIMKAAREQNIGGSLVAAGGWCAPSTNYYDLLQLETTTGALDLPEITVVRGGINFTKGPDFSDIYTSTGFLQTEADAEAGTEKTFLEVDCPDWEEIRLDAIGYGVKAPILTASPAGFPELVRRYLEGALVAHWHKVNAYVINKVVTALGSVQDFTEYGSATGDLLNAIEVAAWSLRYAYRLGENATLEAMFPMWVRGAIRADLSRQNGVSMQATTDAQITSWFTMRGIRPQFVFDWAGQDVSSTAVQFPVAARFGIWPAGSFVKGTNNIISLDAIYDSTEITTNTYTAAFFEEAILVANTGATGRLFEVALNLHGRTGAADLGASDNS
jgi:hypothetical protein